MAEKMRSRKGQIAIWVILAVVLVGAILLFAFVERKPLSGGQEVIEIDSYIEKCVSQSVNEAVEIMLPQGGFLAPKNFKVYNDTNISYLCLHSGYFKPCVNQHPMLVNEMSSEIKGYIKPRVESCFDAISEEIKNRNGELTLGEMSFNVSMAPEKIFVNIKREAKITMQGQTVTFGKFDVEVANPAYNLANVAMEIADNEAKYCAFLANGYMLLYPRWDIRVNTMSDSTKIYYIKDKNSGKRMSIAIRSCAMPAGMGI